MRALFGTCRLALVWKCVNLQRFFGEIKCSQHFYSTLIFIQPQFHLLHVFKALCTPSDGALYCCTQITRYCNFRVIFANIHFFKFPKNIDGTLF